MSSEAPSTTGSAEYERTLSPDQLLQQEGTVPFLGLVDEQAAYPEAVTPAGDRYITDTSRSFKDALKILPQAGEGDLWADNEFVDAEGDGTVTVDVQAIEDVHGLHVERIESLAGASINQLIAEADPEALIEVSDHKDIIDRRRLALRTLFNQDIKFRWQIASDRYEPGDMQQFFKRKIVACQKQTEGDAFGWIDHYDWGGAVTITTIYPGMEQDVGLPDDIDIDADGSLSVIDEKRTSSGADEELTIYYGDRLGYDFRGSQTLWAYPVIYVPEHDVMIQLPEPRFKRRHVGDFMSATEERTKGRVPPVEWHENILDKIDSLTTTVNNEIIRARLLAVDFGDVPFSVTDFYSYLGIPDEYAEEAAKRAKSLAKKATYECPSPACEWKYDSADELREHYSSVHGDSLGDIEDALDIDDSPNPKPSLWNLQLSLKLVLIENFDGARAGDTFQQYQELSGQILRHPEHQLRLAYREHDRQETDENTLLDESDAAQQSLGDSLDEVIDLPGITEDSIDATGAQQINQRVQEKLDSF